MKIRLKLTLVFSGLFGALLLVFALAIYVSNAKDREEQYYKRLHQQAVTKADLLLGAKVAPSVLQLIYKNSLNSLPQEEVAVYDTAFHLLYHDAVYIDRVKETKGMIDTIVRQHEIRFYVGDLQAIGFLYSFEGKDYVITAAAKDIDGLARLRDLRIALIIGFLVAILLTFLAGSLFSRQALRPVSKLVDKVEEITASRLDLRITEAKGKDEIAELASTFNRMLDRLESSFEAQKQFVSHISHEVRTPMATIIGELEIAAKKGRTNTEYEEMNTRLLIDARRVVRLASGLLDLARASYDKAEIAFRPVRIDELLVDTRNAVLKFNPDYRVDIVFEQEIEDDHRVSIEGNAYLLKVAFLNLIENGCKFSADHQTIVAISFHERNIILRFSDNGIGITKEDLAHIFTPFFRGGNKVYAEGHGIGLPLTDKIISLHRGNLSVNSKPGEGTTFTVEFSHL